MSDEDKGIVLHALAFGHWDDENASGTTDQQKGSLAIQAFIRILSDRDSLRTRLGAHHVGDLTDGGHCKMCDAALTSSEKESVDPGVIGTISATKPHQLQQLQQTTSSDATLRGEGKG